MFIQQPCVQQYTRGGSEVMVDMLAAVSMVGAMEAVEMARARAFASCKEGE
jgi:hypothetical protein